MRFLPRRYHPSWASGRRSVLKVFCGPAIERGRDPGQFGTLRVRLGIDVPAVHVEVVTENEDLLVAVVGHVVEQGLQPQAPGRPDRRGLELEEDSPVAPIVHRKRVRVRQIDAQLARLRGRRDRSQRLRGRLLQPGKVEEGEPIAGVQLNDVPGERAEIERVDAPHVEDPRVDVVRGQWARIDACPLLVRAPRLRGGFGSQWKRPACNGTTRGPEVAAAR